MTGFDPAAATAAYLATVSPAQHELARAYTQGGHWTYVWGSLISALAAFLILRSGILVRLAGRLEERRFRPWLAGFLVIAAGVLAESALLLPWSVYADWWRERSYGMTSQPFAGWAFEWTVSTLLMGLATVVLLCLVYALIRRAPRTWWIWSGALSGAFFLFLIVIAPVTVMPLFNSYKPAPPGAVRDAVAEMARAHGVPDDRIVIYDGSRQSNRYTANVAGLGGTARIAMSDVMFLRNADIAEVRAVVGHEMGHYVRRHSIWMAAAYGLVGLVAFLLVHRLFQPMLRLTRARGVRGLSDPAGYPAVSLIITVLALIGLPINNVIVRTVENDADRFSLEVAREPDGLARALVQTIEYRAASPSVLEEILFYDHPSVERRIRTAMDWKARQSSAAPDKHRPG